MRFRVERLRRQVRDDRGGQVVFLSHCLLNQNVRYLGGAASEAGAQDLVAGYLAAGVGVCQMSCPEQAVGAHTVPGRGLFVTALRRRFNKRGLDIRMVEYDFAARADPGPAEASPFRREA